MNFVVYHCISQCHSWALWTHSLLEHKCRHSPSSVSYNVTFLMAQITNLLTLCEKEDTWEDVKYLQEPSSPASPACLPCSTPQDTESMIHSIPFHCFKSIVSLKFPLLHWSEQYDQRRHRVKPILSTSELRGDLATVAAVYWKLLVYPWVVLQTAVIGSTSSSDSKEAPHPVPSIKGRYVVQPTVAD